MRIRHGHVVQEGFMVASHVHTHILHKKIVDGNLRVKAHVNACPIVVMSQIMYV
jgi:hypothetical protein